MNPKNTCLIFLLCLSFIPAKAQTRIAIPSEKEFEHYFYARQQGITTKLYNLALQGRIKAYKTDSLASFYSQLELKDRGSRQVELKMQTFKPEELQGIMFLKGISPIEAGVADTSRLLGLALLFEPYYGGIKGIIQPMFWVSTSDLKNMLEESEMEFLSSIYFYSRNSNSVRMYWEADNPSFDAFWDLNNSNRVHIWPDSTFYKMAVSMLKYSQFYFPVLFHDMGHRESTKNPLIFDEQQNKHITRTEFDNTYKRFETVFLSTDPNNPAIGKDTTFEQPFNWDFVNAISFDNKTKKLSKYHFSFRLNETDKKTLDFYINVSFNRHLAAVQPIIWFYEDYIRWKKL
jgi:hypothetical protein